MTNGGTDGIHVFSSDACAVDEFGSRLVCRREVKWMANGRTERLFGRKPDGSRIEFDDIKRWCDGYLARS